MVVGDVGPDQGSCGLYGHTSRYHQAVGSCRGEPPHHNQELTWFGLSSWSMRGLTSRSGFCFRLVAFCWRRCWLDKNVCFYKTNQITTPNHSFFNETIVRNCTKSNYSSLCVWLRIVHCHGAGKKNLRLHRTFTAYQFWAIFLCLCKT